MWLLPCYLLVCSPLVHRGIGSCVVSVPLIMTWAFFFFFDSVNTALFRMLPFGFQATKTSSRRHASWQTCACHNPHAAVALSGKYVAIIRRNMLENSWLKPNLEMFCPCTCKAQSCVLQCLFLFYSTICLETRAPLTLIINKALLCREITAIKRSKKFRVSWTEDTRSVGKTTAAVQHLCCRRVPPWFFGHICGDEKKHISIRSQELSVSISCRRQGG